VGGSQSRIGQRKGNCEGLTPLIAAASRREGLSLVVWLLDEKGADVMGVWDERAPSRQNARHSERLAGPWWGPHSISP